jgi:hypothetical protein
MAEIVGAQLVVRVVRAGNFSELSAPHPYHANGRAVDLCAATGCDAPEPAWKKFADRKEYVHPRRPTFRGGSE